MNALPTRQQVMDAFSAVLKAARDTTDLTQEKLAERAEIDVSYVSYLERAERCPNIWILLKLGSALNVDAALIITMTLGRLRGDP
jgi:ribosome-binding protein aMBF1 (putative translation factor)